MAKLIYVIYHSDTGNTHKLAQLIAEGAQKEGAQVELAPASELNLAEVARADGYAIGSPDYFSYVAGEIKCFFDKVLYDERFKGKPFVGFGTHGGGGKVLECLNRLGKAIGLRQVAEGVQVKEAPTRDDADAVRGLGKILAQALAEPDPNARVR